MPFAQAHSEDTSFQSESLDPVLREFDSESERLRVLAQWRSSASRARDVAMLRALQANFTGASAAHYGWQGNGDSELGSTLDSSDAPAAGAAGWDSLPEGVTTFMVRNIPPQCKLEDLLHDWPIDGSFDFLELPMSTGGRYALGYAFINLASSEHAAAFLSRWQSARLDRFPTGRCLRLAVSDLQGLEANVRRLQAKPTGRLRSRHCSPIILKNGRPVDLRNF